MKKNPRLLGDQHVKAVCEALGKYIKQESIDEYPNKIVKTVKYIVSIFPNIQNVESKFSEKHPDLTNDLKLFLNDNATITVNLFLIKKGARIQPKNLGAKSFFSKYFLSQTLQDSFNIAFEEKYIKFLSGLLEAKEGVHYIANKREMKSRISSYFPNFLKEINPLRDKFLYGLREECFFLLKDFFNEKNEAFFHAYNVLFMTEDTNIITAYGSREEDVAVYEFNPGKPSFRDIEIYKVGKNTVGIKYGEVGLTLRFKFESGPTSSIKLAISYEELPDNLEISTINSKTIHRMSELINSHIYLETTNSSNAIGKCHEALTYYYFLKEYPEILQVDPEDSINLLDRYYSSIKPTVLNNLYSSTSTIVPVIREHLDEKYSLYEISSIELIPDSYIDDKLNTGDLQLILKKAGNYIIENISLKALARRGTKITTKNPGIGSILGSTYFNVGSLEPVVKEVKSKFQVGELNHQGSLEALSLALGEQLGHATQEQLKRGVENLLGKAVMAVTFYEESISYCKEHSQIKTPIMVSVRQPTPIQNTLSWSNGLETISLRVKFSKRQAYGWSTIKLTSEYQLK
ncbi:hypothetical protein SFC50_04470 [Bacillus infantis]|uniref:hypothetical protein n=1 Tax=Bacillus infantis TaxID=324767 RepID=UPI003982549D